MPRPPKKFSPAILRTLTSRPKLRYTLTAKGAKALRQGELGTGEDEVEDLVQAMEANNKQPVSMATWQVFRGRNSPLRNNVVRGLVEDRFITIIARSKTSSVLQEEKRK